MKTIITYGTFDLLHHGHIKLLERLSMIADKVIVALSTDSFNQQKGKQAVYSYQQRLKMLQATGLVDMIIAEDNWQQKITDIKQYDVDMFAIGDDWQGQFDYLTNYCHVIYLPRTQQISTTQIKQSLGLHLHPYKRLTVISG